MIPGNSQYIENDTQWDKCLLLVCYIKAMVKYFGVFLFSPFVFFGELDQSILQFLECLIYDHFLKGRHIMKSVYFTHPNRELQPSQDF